MTSTACRTLLLTILLVAPAAAQTSDPPVASAPCEHASDDQYGYTRERAIQVGGSPMYGAARQRRYLDALRGPQGQAVTYKRTGQTRAGQTPVPADDTILDVYEVTYEGLEKAVALFLDWYHYTPPRAPRGFTCGAPFNLGLPPVDPFQESKQLRAVAVAQGATADWPPIAAGIEGKPPAAAVYDEFRLIGLAARAAAAKGSKINPEPGPADMKAVGQVVVAYPVRCEERLLKPLGLALHGQTGGIIPRAQMDELSPDQISRFLPGVVLPDGAKAFGYQLARPRPNDGIVISYPELEACDVRRDVLQLALRATPAKLIDAPPAELPAGTAGPATVYLQAVLDLEGRLLEPVYIGGPRELESAAREALAKWRAEPYRVNGTPVAIGVVLQVRFGPS